MPGDQWEVQDGADPPCIQAYTALPLSAIKVKGIQRARRTVATLRSNEITKKTDGHP